MKLLQEYVSFHAAAHPRNVAVVSGRDTLSYHELDEYSNRLARTLRQHGCTPGDRVCFLLPKSPMAVVTILGILKAGCIYTPLDPASPPVRLAGIIERLDARWILTSKGSGTLLQDLLSNSTLRSALSVGWLDDEDNVAVPVAFSIRDVHTASPDAMAPGNTPEDPAYILFTSGSTGTPKGVVIRHDNVVHFVEWAKEYFAMQSSDRISGHIPLHFDLSVFDIFGTFAAGASLYLVPPELNLLPNKLAEFIRVNSLTQWFSVPSVLNLMAKFNVVRQNDFPHLKRLLWCGEVFPTPSLIYWMRRLLKVPFTNLYGPTETTIASSYYTVPECPAEETASIPIGRPCTGESLYVLDEGMNRVPAGVTGDLYIGGVGLSDGYWRDPEKTREVFLANPFVTNPGQRIYRTGDLAKVGEDGLVYFVGRADTQIKSRGYRIELGEIENALNTVSGIRESAVVAVMVNGFEGAAICCAFSVSPGHLLSAQEVRARLAEHLPAYMLPTRWLVLDSLPKNANGKIDRPGLKMQFLDGK